MYKLMMAIKSSVVSKKAVYPSDNFISGSIERGELYILTDSDTLYACVILNSEHNDGYDGCPWSIDCDQEDVITLHALAVNPKFQRNGIVKIVVDDIINIAKTEHKKEIRLDVLGVCEAAERLYRNCRFQFVEAKKMFYEDTGWTVYKLFELNLGNEYE